VIPLGQFSLDCFWGHNRHTRIAPDQSVDFCSRGRDLLVVAQELFLKAAKLQRGHEHVAGLSVAGSDASVGRVQQRLKLRFVRFRGFNLLDQNVELVPRRS
jgi:hypothetical protein